MHEASLILGMFDTIESDYQDYEIEKVTRIELEIGRLSNAEPLILKQSFEVLKAGTVFEGALFDIINVATEVRCLVCNSIYYPEDFPFMCSNCESLRSEILKGDQILLTKLEMEVK